MKSQGIFEPPEITQFLDLISIALPGVVGTILLLPFAIRGLIVAKRLPRDTMP